MEAQTMKRNGKIEFFRFIFCISIIFFHCQRHFLNIDKTTQHFAFFPRGYFGVEFFFLVTGFLMAKSVSSSIQSSPISPDLGKGTFSFMVRKIKAILPYHVIAFTILFMATAIMENFSPRQLMINFLDYLPNLFFIQKIGFGPSLNRVEWYICCMLFSLAILYPLCRKYYSMFVHIIAPVGGLMILGYLTHQYGTFAPGTEKWIGFIPVYLLRSIAEIALGTSAFQLATYLSKLQLTQAKKILFTATEFLCYLTPLFFCMTTLDAKYEIIFTIALFFAIATSFSNQTYGNQLFNNRFVYSLGSWSLVLYLNQVVGLDIAENLLPPNPMIQTAAVLGITFISAALSEIVIKAAKLVTKRFQK